MYTHSKWINGKWTVWQKPSHGVFFKMYTLLSTTVQKQKSVFTTLLWPSYLTLFGFTADLIIWKGTKGMRKQWQRCLKMFTQFSCFWNHLAIWRLLCLTGNMLAQFIDLTNVSTGCRGKNTRPPPYPGVLQTYNWLCLLVGSQQRVLALAGAPMTPTAWSATWARAGMLLRPPR